MNHLWKERELGERGEGKGAIKHKTTSINYPKHSLQATLATLLRYNNSRNLFCFCCYNFPILNQSFKGGSFHISNTEDYTTCQKQTILFSAGLGGCWLPYLARNIRPEVSGSLFPFKFTSHDRVLDRQFFLFQMDLALDSKFAA